MKRRGGILFIALIILSGSISNIYSQWVQSKGPYGTANTIFVDEQFIWIGGEGRIFGSDDGGNSWKEYQLYAQTPDIYSIISVDGSYLAGTSRGLYKFNGEYWEFLSPDYIIHQMFYDGNKLWAATENGVYTSDDVGETWNLVYAESYFSFTAIYVRGDTVFAGTAESGIFRSTDYGATWEGKNNGLDYLGYIYGFAFLDGRLFASVGGTPYITTDNGEYWWAHVNGLNDGTVKALSTSESYYYIYAATTDGIYKCPVPIAEWSKVGESVEMSLGFTNDVFDYNGTLYAASDWGVYKMNNAPFNTWNAIGIPNSDVVDLDFRADTLFAATHYHGIYISDDNAATWHLNVDRVYLDVPNGIVADMALTDTSIYVATSYGLLRRNPSDYHWTLKLYGDNVWSVAAEGNIVYASIQQQGIKISQDGGNTWEDFSNGLPEYSYVNKILITSQNLFASVLNNGIYRYDTDSSKWVPANNGIENLSFRDLFEKNGMLYAGGFGIYVSTDNGATWTEKDEGITDLNIHSVYATDNYVFAGTEYGGVFVSSDDAETWHEFNENITYMPIEAIISDDSCLYVGTGGHGVWKRPLSEIVTDIEETEKLPTSFILKQNYPNPFNPTTTISYSIPTVVSRTEATTQSVNVTLDVYNVLGQKVATLVNKEQTPGNYGVQFNASDLPSGVYFYTLHAGDLVATKKMILMK